MNGKYVKNYGPMQKLMESQEGLQAGLNTEVSAPWSRGPICLGDELTHGVTMEPSGIMGNAAGLTTWGLEGTAFPPVLGMVVASPSPSLRSLRGELVCGRGLEQ